MEEIRRAAGAYYKHLPENKKEEATETFNAMDKNRDGKINRDEYLEYLKKDNNTVLQSLFTQEYLKKDKVLPSLFKELDKDGNGSLDFEEAIVLYYIMKSGRAIICKGCDSFLAGAYFSCSQCFFNKDDSVSTYDLCCDCYGDKKFVHNDIGHIFCDNYTLLRQSRSLIQEAPPTKRTKVLGLLKKGMQAAGITSSDIAGIITGESPPSLWPSRQTSFTILQVEDDINNNQRAYNGPADGLNQKDLFRKIFYAMNLLLEMATAVLDYVSSQQRQPRYALSSMILSITVMAISLIQLAYTGRKEEVSWQWKGWIPWFYHPDPSNKLFGNPVQIVELFFSVSQCVFAIIAYHYLSRDQNNPTQFSVYPIVFAFFLLCLSFRRREPRVKVSEKI